VISVDPLTKVALGHRALHLGVADAGHIVALSKEGVGSLLGPDHLSVTTFDVASHSKGVAISPAGDLLAVLENDALALIRLPEFIDLHRIDQTIESCRFSPSGRSLWCAVRVSGEMAALEIRETKNWQVVARVEVPDPFEDSGLMLFHYPNEDRVVLWVAAGQDGQCLYWGHYNGSKLTVEPFPDLTDTTPPGFDCSGERFLVVSGDSVRLYQYPAGPELGRMIWPFDDDPPGETVAFVGAEHALIHSGDGNLFLIDLRQMLIADEIRVRGHEPRPVDELYPNLRGEGGLCSDLSTFVPLPAGGFLSVHCQPPLKSITDWRDQLLKWKVPHDVQNRTLRP
jgi:hypothetical protein